ncbi:MAG TPA: hypothetical protein VF338_09165, partial [Leptolinea sp.]
MELTADQLTIARYPLEKKIFLRGEAGTGKTTIAVARLEKMIQNGIAAETILLLVPQRPLARPYTLAASNPGLPPGGRVSILTIGGLARRMDELFWPLVSETAGFTHPEISPQFLTIETTQYFLSQIVDPLREKGYFDGIAIEPVRLYGQILDNLNKTAVVDFSIEEIAPRLRAAWNGNQADARYFDQAQDCAARFRQYCLEHSILDFSLQMEIFTKFLWHEKLFQKYLQERYVHLIYDNVEEDFPVAHDIVREWIPAMKSALIIFDESAGYRSFLGADSTSAESLSITTERTFHLNDPMLTPVSLVDFKLQLSEHIQLDSQNNLHSPVQLKEITLHYSRFFPQMLDAVVKKIENSINSGVKPGEIVVLSPFVSDSLRFSLQTRLEKKGLALTTHRPGRDLGNEPAVRCLITLAKLVFTQWKQKVNPLEFRTMLMTAVDGMDLIRADLLSHTVLSNKPDADPLNPFSSLKPEMAERITFQLGEKYETLMNWVLQSRKNPSQDLPEFFSRCFGELLSQKGFGFHFSYDMADATNRLIESARQFDVVI